MSVAPGARHSAVHRAMQSSNDKKSFLQRACSSPSIVSLYQEPFKEPGTIIADYNPPGNIFNNPSLYSSDKLIGKNDANESHVNKSWHESKFIPESRLEEDENDFSFQIQIYRTHRGL